MPEFPSNEDASDKTMTIGLVLAAIIASLLLVGTVFKLTSQERQVNQTSAQSLADDNTKAREVQ